MTAVQVPAELVEFWATTATVQAEAPQPDRATLRQLAASIRALLPQPEPTCPVCGGRTKDHYVVPGELSDCWVPLERVAELRALLAAERDAKPAIRQPRVWNVGDPEPSDVEQVLDRDGDVWGRGDNGIWNTPETRGFPWEHVVRKWSPLTEVLPGGDR